MPWESVLKQGSRNTTSHLTGMGASVWGLVQIWWSRGFLVSDSVA